MKMACGMVPAIYGRLRRGGRRRDPAAVTFGRVLTRDTWDASVPPPWRPPSPSTAAAAACPGGEAVRSGLDAEHLGCLGATARATAIPVDGGGRVDVGGDRAGGGGQ